MGITEDDLNPYVVFYIDVVIYLKDENNLHFFVLFGEDFADLFLKLF